MHRTFQRFVAALMLLSFAAMFGAAYLPVDHHETSLSVVDAHEIVVENKMITAMTGAHDCCDQDMAANAIEELRCSVDCSYYFSSNEFAFYSSSPAFGDGVTHSMFLAQKTSVLRPPIA